MPVAKPVSSNARVIAHVDMDCFYVQVEQRKQPQLRGLPTAVVQYNEWKGGALIAVSYEARKHGVKRSMRGDEAKKVCPQIQLVQVPVARGKADLSTYRNAGSEVVSILAGKGRCQRASIDEVYLDLTDAAEMMLAESPPETLENVDEEVLNSHILGLREEGIDARENVRNWLHRSDADHFDKLLSCGAIIVAELRRQVLKETEFTCSAGVAHNKMLAKLASGMNKPAQQTVVLSAAVKELLGPLPIKKMKQLGGKLGDSLKSDLGVNTVGDLLQFSEQKLQEFYGVNTGTWLWNIARGISGEEVEGRILPKSHGSGKTFPGPRALKSIDLVVHWLKQLCEELSERLLADLNQNKRVAHTLTLHVRAYKSSDADSQKKFPSKSCPLRYGTSKLQEDALSLFHVGLREFMGIYGVKVDKNHNSGWGVTGLSVSASKIVAIPQGTSTIMKFFPSQCAVLSSSSQDTDDESIHVRVHLPGEEIMIKDHISGLDENDSKGKSQNQKDQFVVKEVGPVTRFFQEQVTSCSLSNNGPGEGSLCLSRSESKHCSEIGPTDPSYKVLGKDPTLFPASPASQLLDREIKESKMKGTPSILRFLKRSEHLCSQSKLDQNGISQERFKPTYSGVPEADSACQSRENAKSREKWSYNVDEIDPSIIDELPSDIQEELRGWMRPLKQPHAVKQRCHITSYFSPMKDAS